MCWSQFNISMKEELVYFKLLRRYYLFYYKVSEWKINIHSNKVIDPNKQIPKGSIWLLKARSDTPGCYVTLVNWCIARHEQILEAKSYNDHILLFQNMKKKECFTDIILAIWPQRKQDFLKLIFNFKLIFLQRDCG